MNPRESKVIDQVNIKEDGNTTINSSSLFRSFSKTQYEFLTDYEGNNDGLEALEKVDRTGMSEEQKDYTSFYFILKNLSPNFGSAFFYYIISFLETHFIGQQKDAALLDGIGLALTYSTLLFYNQGLGISEALAVLCSKSYGLKDYKMINIYTKQARFLTLIYALIYTLINIFFIENILNVLAPGETYIDVSKDFIIYTMPSLFLELQFEITAKFSESQLIYKPVLFGLASALVVNPILCWFTLSHLKMGVWGCIITTNATAIVKICVITLTSACLNKTSEQKISAGLCDFKDYFKGFKKHLIIVLTCIWATFMESGGKAITGFIAVRMGQHEYAKYIVLMNIANMFVILQYSFYNTCCILVGNIVGINRPSLLSKLMRNFYIVVIIVSTTVIILVIILHNPITFFFTELDDIKGSDIFWEIVFLSIGEGLSCIQQLSNGLVIGLEKIKRASLIAFMCYFIILPSLSYFMGIYFNLGLIGIILSFLICHTFGATCLSIMICCLNYQKCCKDYQVMLQLSNEKDEEELRMENEEELEEDNESIADSALSQSILKKL